MIIYEEMNGLLEECSRDGNGPRNGGDFNHISLVCGFMKFDKNRKSFHEKKFMNSRISRFDKNGSEQQIEQSAPKS
jgi:hypothetical protein